MIRLLHDLYSALWSNMWAPSVWTILGLALSHIKLKAHYERKLNELHERLTNSGRE